MLELCVMRNRKPKWTHETQLQRAERILKLVGDNRRSLLEGLQETEWLKRVCDALIGACGYKMAWVGSAEEDTAHSVTPVASAGFENGYTGHLHITWGADKYGRGPTGTAIRTGQASVMRHVPTDPAFAPWREAAVKSGFASSVALPLNVAGRVIGALNIYAEEDDGFGTDEVKLLGTLAEDISFGIAFLREKSLRLEADRLIKKEKNFSDQLLNTVQASILLLDEKGNILYMNPCLEKLSGYSQAEVKGKEAFATLLPKREWQSTRHLFSVATKSGITLGNISTLVTKDGTERLVQWDGNVMLDDRGQFAGLLTVATDITERRQFERTLERSESRLKEAQQIAHLGSWELNLVEDSLWWSDESFRIFGVERRGNNNYEAFENVVHPDDREFVNQAYTGSVKNRIPYDIEHRLNTQDGTVRWVSERCQTFYAEDGTPLRSIGTTLDITQRKLAEEALRSSKDLLQFIIENAPIRVFWKDTQLRYLGCNIAFARDAGMTQPEDLVGKNDFDMGWREQAELYRADDSSVMKSGIAKLGYEEPQTTPDGKRIWLRTSKIPMRDLAGEIFGMLGIYDDITQLKETEIALEHANRALQALSTVNRELVRATDELGLLNVICTAIVEEGGYGMAWVGYLQHDDVKSIQRMASAGDALGIFERVRPSWSENDHGTGLSGRAVRTGKTQVSANIAQDPQYESWKDELGEQGWFSSIALPLTSNGEVFGILHVYAKEVNAFTETEVSLLEEMAEDLAFGITALRLRQERDNALKLDELHLGQLRRNLDETVVAISKAVEARDPYTAGHERRVAELAVAIGRQMGLDDDVLDGIRIGATIHDIGKIKVPAEILAKPSQLSKLEYMIIQEHPQVGYEILKDIHFPWPVADIAHQHHERFDGSGYPQGLKGEAICLEARIVAVADVVEAMSSHRPYRAGKGIDAALEEIRKNRGKLYDPVIVDATLDAFAKGFAFPQ